MLLLLIIFFVLRLFVVGSTKFGAFKGTPLAGSRKSCLVIRQLLYPCPTYLLAIIR